MSGTLWRRLTRALAWLEPPPRIVDWSIFTVVVVAGTTGVVSFLGVSGAWIPVFWIHRTVGLCLTVLLGFKLARVRHRLTNTGQWQPTTALSVLTALVAFGAVGTGIVWVFGYNPDLPYIQFLSVHVALGLALLVVMILHQSTRFRPPRRVDFDRRRTSLQYSVMLVGGALTYRGQEAVNNVLDTAGTKRRLTGSYHEEGTGNESFPVTSWVADDPAPLDVDEWTLSVTGAVERPLELGYEEVSPETSAEVLLDCTSGWYTVQDWAGVRVGDLLDDAAASDDARYVRFVSVTGYRWSLPLDEARDALLATHVGGEQLSHGHGRPLRLVAPGRRGFQWVKWVHRVEVRRQGDPAQWLATLVSGFSDET
jgi:DMSO/TMAO reductase YedYZ molybdopterin-dependent catalytic subunit